MRAGQCPSCGAPVEFLPGAGKVKVCEHCSTVVLRGAANLEALGKVAELTETGSPLKLHLSGRYSGNPFTVAGRIQKQNAAGTWDEWCLAFDDGRTGWLSESEGEWNFMTPLEGVELPDVARLEPLSGFSLRERRFVVEEKNRATTLAAEGQLPDFHREHLYVDATGPKGIFCSLDSADGVTEAYVGSRVTLDQLGFSKGELSPRTRKETLTGARCTQCNGMLDLKAPDAAKRVACPYCGALLEVQSGKLAFLQLLEKPPHEPAVPLGATGTLFGTEWTVLAFLIRSCTVDGNRYPWDEYLLWNRQAGFRWLMCSNGHFSFLTPVPAGEVALGGLDARTCSFEGTSYKAYQTVFTRTDFVLGECYWSVSEGETARATEFIAPPKDLNLDLTDTEVTFTKGELVPPEEIAKAFRLPKPLDPPRGIAPSMVNPFLEKASSAWSWFGIWSAALLACVVAFAVIGSRAELFRGSFSVAPGVAPSSPESQRFSEPFEIPKTVPLEVEVGSPDLDNGWEGVSVDLVNMGTGEVVEVYAENSYYHGVDDGESWSEGSRSDSKQTAEVDKGQYVLRVTPHFDPGRPTDYLVTVRADDGPGFCCPFTLFLFLLLVPIFYQVRSSGFETERWADSVFQGSPGGFSSGDSDDDDDDSDDSSDSDD